SIDGHMHEIERDFRRQSDLDIGSIRRFDQTLAAYDPGAHVSDDLFANKLAFVILLNFPLTTLDERRQKGEAWTRREWAEARLAERFSKRIPAAVKLATAKASAEADQYIAGYNIWMHHVVDSNGTRLFPPKLRLLSHWNLRDEIKADYTDTKNGLAKQRAIMKVMERIVTQTIPDSVVDNPQVDWNPVTNEVRATTDKDSAREASIRRRNSTKSCARNIPPRRRIRRTFPICSPSSVSPARRPRCWPPTSSSTRRAVPAMRWARRGERTRRICEHASRKM